MSSYLAWLPGMPLGRDTSAAKGLVGWLLVGFEVECSCDESERAAIMQLLPQPLRSSLVTEHTEATNLPTARVQILLPSPASLFSPNHAPCPEFFS